MHLATFQRIAAGLLVAALATACSSGGSDPAPDQASAKPSAAAAPAKQKTFLDAQLKAIDKAKAVEQTLKQGKANTDQAIEDSGG